MSTFTNDLIVNEYLKTERLQQEMNKIIYQPIISESIKLKDNQPIISESIKIKDNQLFIIYDKQFDIGKTSPRRKNKN